MPQRSCCAMINKNITITRASPHAGFGHYLTLLGMKESSSIRHFDRVRSMLRSTDNNLRRAAMYIHTGKSSPAGDAEMETDLKKYVFSVHPTLVHKQGDIPMHMGQPRTAAHTIDLYMGSLSLYQRFVMGNNTLQSLRKSVSVRARRHQIGTIIATLIDGQCMRARYQWMQQLQRPLHKVFERIKRFLARRNLAENYRTLAVFAREQVQPVAEACLRLEIPLSTAHVRNLVWPTVIVGPAGTHGAPGPIQFDSIRQFNSAPWEMLFPKYRMPRAACAIDSDGNPQRDEYVADAVDSDGNPQYDEYVAGADADSDLSNATNRGQGGVDTVLFAEDCTIGIMQVVSHNEDKAKKRVVVSRLSNMTSSLLHFLHRYHHKPRFAKRPTEYLFKAERGGQMTSVAVTAMQRSLHSRLNTPFSGSGYAYRSQISKLCEVYASTGHDVVQTNNAAFLLGLTFANYDPRYGYVVFEQLKRNQDDLDTVGLRKRRLEVARIDRDRHMELQGDEIAQYLLLREGSKPPDKGLVGMSFALSRVLELPSTLTPYYSDSVKRAVGKGGLQSWYRRVFRDDRGDISQSI